MKTNQKSKQPLEDVRVNVKVKLTALWTAVMFLYAYADIQHLVLQPGSVDEILKGTIGGIQITPMFLFGAAVLMVIPSVMIYLSVALPARINRWTNLIVGSAYTLVTVITVFMPPRAWSYYYFYNVMEVVLTALVVWHAARWARVAIDDVQ